MPFERSLATPYLHDPDIRRMVERLRRLTITDELVETLARAVHGRTAVAGRPVPWAEDGDIVRGVRWDERARNRARAEARRVLEEGLPDA